MLDAGILCYMQVYYVICKLTCVDTVAIAAIFWTGSITTTHLLLSLDPTMLVHTETDNEVPSECCASIYNHSNTQLFAKTKSTYFQHICS